MPAVTAIIDDSRAMRKYARLLNRFSNMRPVMGGPVKQLVRRFINDQFNTRGAAGGHPWKALADETIRQKARMMRTGDAVSMAPLRLTDAMRKSLLGRGPAGSFEERVSPQGYSLRTLVRSDDERQFPYPASHATGTADGHVPARPIIPEQMPQGFMRELRRLTRGWLIEVEFSEDDGT
jgi:hypothetical protein